MKEAEYQRLNGVTGQDCTHLAEPPQDRLTASRYPPAIEAWAAPASPALDKHTCQTIIVLSK